MKKNKMMRLASAMMVMTLMTTSVISGTFAKYTTQDDGSDSARVAKWGVELQVVGNLYGESYDDEIVADEGDDTLSVQAYDWKEADDDVVAPGTKNEDGFSFKLNGTPEVDGKVVTTISYENIYLEKGTYGVMVLVPAGVVTAENITTLGTLYVKAGTSYVPSTTYGATTEYYTLEDSVTVAEKYYPVEYKMTGALANYNTAYDTALSTDTLAGVVTAFTANLGTAGTPTVADGKTTNTWTTTFDTNTNLATALKIGGQNIQWKWDFCQQTECPDGDSACGYCKADTVLGNIAANLTVVKAGEGTSFVPVVATTDYNLETELSVNITVTQVD